jgi:hypothetical protein
MPSLRLLRNDELTSGPGPVPSVSLQGAPFRPGELPVLSWIRLDSATRDQITAGATRAGVPTEVWVRIAVESSRLAAEISVVIGRSTYEINEYLDLDAARGVPSGKDVPIVEAVGLLDYAKQLRTPQRPGVLGRDNPLRLPEEMTGAWRAAATYARLSLPEWIAERLAEASPGCVRWEIAAAESFQSLGEWAYASALRVATSSRA